MDLKSNSYLREIETALNNWDTHKGFLRTNDIQGVDLLIEIEPDKLGLDADEDTVQQMLEDHYENSDFCFQLEVEEKTLWLTTSSCEDVFITYDNVFIYPSGKLHSLNKEYTHWDILATLEEHFEDSGIYSSVYNLDYNGNPDLCNYSEWEEYKQLSSDEKKKKEQLEGISDTLTFLMELEQSSLTLEDIPSEFNKVIPQELKDYLHEIEILSVVDFNIGILKLEVEIISETAEELKEFLDKIPQQKESKYGVQIELTLDTIPQAIRYIKEEL